MAFRNSLFVFRLRDELSQGSSKPSSCRSDEVKSQQMAITIKGHDSTRDLIMLNQSRMSQVELNRNLEETTRNLKCMANALKTEKQRTDELLCELMPPSVAESLRQGNTVEASEFPEATILFTDNICLYIYRICSNNSPVSNSSPGSINSPPHGWVETIIPLFLPHSINSPVSINSPL
uniref:guanylate cyclase n=1 Tax=Meloidogyne incognita TaxID=6306 RepID=A0A914N5X8_MELIC